VAQERIEDLPARAGPERRRQLGQALVARKLIGEAKRTGGDLGFEARQMGAGTT
jgi:hypothetical protein